MGKFCLFILLLFSGLAIAQDPTDNIVVDAKTKRLLATQDSIANLYDANRPSKAAFYSAVVPGLGQAYNGKYWKIPLIYGAIGGSIYAFMLNDNEYDRLREAFQIRLAGGSNDEYSNPDGTPIISNLGLERAQKVSQRNKELSLLIAAAFYAIQIIDANVDGHLSQFDVDRDLSFKPYLDYNQSASGTSYGFALSFTF
ncbi:DUF5683 domain-containing protein [Nonlabens antarcticus]|uniref:DUF5683 domain-containing protein n=1 Tax=Nonlabens antarcticus TaxID=392714 RepID=UPI001E5008A0|nr:DUF5683 domain-containing protein [Nonlabens antarcticus]